MKRKDLTLKLKRYCSSYELEGVWVCGAAGDWLVREYGTPDNTSGPPESLEVEVPVRRVWEECCVPAWMSFILDSIAAKLDHPTHPFVEEIDEDVRPNSLTEGGVHWLWDGEAREDMADALRVVYPVEYVLELAAELRSWRD